MTGPSDPRTNTLPATARFQVDDQPEIPLAHLLRVNPEFTDEDCDVIQAMKPGDVQTFGHARLRRTR